MNDQDKEMLLMAAKAVGLKPDLSPTNGGGNGNDGFCFDTMVLDWHNNITWKPLEDDGDLLRLVRKLKITIDYHDCCAYHWGANASLIQEFWGGECGTEEYAILRVAAAIGEAMP